MEASTPQDNAFYKAHKEDNLSHSIIIAMIACLIHSYVAVAVRCACRRYVKARLEADDWFIILSLLPLTAMTAVTGVQVSAGMGKHILYVTDFAKFANSIIPAEIFYVLTLVCTKLSVLYFYRRIFPNRPLVLMSYVVASVVIAYSLAMIVVISVYCRPGSSMWTSAGETGICVYKDASFTALAVLNVITNFAIIVLPIKYILGLQMSLNKKLHMIGIFSLGTVVCIVTLLRLTLPQPWSPAADSTYHAAQGTLWSEIELTAAIFCACATTYRPVCSMGSRFFSRAKYYSVKTFSTYGASKRDSGMSESTLMASEKSVRKGTMWSSVKRGGSERLEYDEVRPFGRTARGPVEEVDLEERGIRVESRVEVWEERERHYGKA